MLRLHIRRVKVIATTRIAPPPRRALAQAESVAGWAFTNPMIFAWSCARFSAAGAETVGRVYVGLPPQFATLER